MNWTHEQMRNLLAPRSVAVLGASERNGPGRQVLVNLEALGFQGNIIPVNPKYETVLGYPCYPSLAAAAEAVGSLDAVAILLGRERVLPALKEASSLGIKAAWAFASGFSESDELGQTLHKELVVFCRENNMAFCGPNCVGIANPGASVGLFSAPLPTSFPSGGISLVSQSGSICLALINGARDVGFRTIVSSGNESILDSTDYLDYFLDDPDTHVLAAFIEQLRDPQRFVETAKRAKNVGKPFVLLKVGRSEIARRATVAHTGALAGSDDVYDAVFRKHGVIRVHDLDEMMQTAAAFSGCHGTFPKGPRVGMLTLSGGAISLAADTAEGSNLTFPEWSESAVASFARFLPDYADISNPLDAWGSGRLEDTYKDCIQIAAADDVDMVVLSQDAPAGIADAQRDQFAIVARAAAEARTRMNKPMIAMSHLSGGLDPELRDIFTQAGVPLLQGTRESLRAIEHLTTFGVGQAATASPREPMDQSAVFASEHMGVLDEIESKKLFARAGIPCIEEQACLVIEDATAAAAEIGYPVVVKGISASIPHKTDEGLVLLNIIDEAGLRAAFKDIRDRMIALSVVEPTIVVQRMEREAVAEMIVGVARDSSFGPCVILGLGGKWVEIACERSIGLPPLQVSEVISMMKDLQGGRLLEGSRGLRDGDIEALTNVLLRISDLALSSPSNLLAMEINPLLVLPKGRGVVAVDGLIEFAGNRDETRGERHE
jgi:acetate---CoA ligase (ADP-forming)